MGWGFGVGIGFGLGIRLGIGLEGGPRAEHGGVEYVVDHLLVVQHHVRYLPPVARMRRGVAHERRVVVEEGGGAPLELVEEMSHGAMRLGLLHVPG